MIDDLPQQARTTILDIVRAYHANERKRMAAELRELLSVDGEARRQVETALRHVSATNAG